MTIKQLGSAAFYHWVSIRMPFEIDKHVLGACWCALRMSIWIVRIIGPYGFDYLDSKIINKHVFNRSKKVQSVVEESVFLRIILAAGRNANSGYLALALGIHFGLGSWFLKLLISVNMLISTLKKAISILFDY